LLLAECAGQGANCHHVSASARASDHQIFRIYSSHIISKALSAGDFFIKNTEADEIFFKKTLHFIATHIPHLSSSMVNSLT
jgi:hypothetical protein